MTYPPPPVPRKPWIPVYMERGQVLDVPSPTPNVGLPEGRSSWGFPTEADPDLVNVTERGRKPRVRRATWPDRKPRGAWLRSLCRKGRK